MVKTWVFLSMRVNLIKRLDTLESKLIPKKILKFLVVNSGETYTEVLKRTSINYKQRGHEIEYSNTLIIVKLTKYGGPSANEWGRAV